MREFVLSRTRSPSPDQVLDKLLVLLLHRLDADRSGRVDADLTLTLTLTRIRARTRTCTRILTLWPQPQP